MTTLLENVYEKINIFLYLDHNFLSKYISEIIIERYNAYQEALEMLVKSLEQRLESGLPSTGGPHLCFLILSC